MPEGPEVPNGPDAGGNTALRVHNPSGVAAPVSSYSHGIEVPPNARWLYVSGQVAVDAGGATPDGIEAQAHLAWSNLVAVLESAGMGVGDLVKVTAYLTREADLPAFRAVRDAFQGQARPASTLVFVKALARPEWLVEVEAVAARP